MTKPILTPEMLRKLLRYEPDTGLLFWRERTPDLFSDGKQTAEHNCKAWNGRHFGKEAFTSTNDCGYRRGQIFNRTLRAHRVIFAIVHGLWPSHEIDHENHDRTDNRIANLRDATRLDNSRNSSMSMRNKSGTTGVRWHKMSGKWMADIGVGGVTKYLGVFTKIADAIAARKAAEIKHGYHPNHGRS